MPPDLSSKAIALKAQHPDWGYIRIGKQLGLHKDKVRRAIEHAERKALPAPLPPQGEIDFYESACQMLAQAKTADEAKEGMDRAEAIRVYARRAKNYQLEADAYAIREKYERKLGLMLTAAKDKGQVSRGQPPKNCAPEEQFSRIKLEDYGIDRKLSARAQKKGGIAERAFEAMLARKRDEIVEGKRAPDMLKDMSTEGKKEARANREQVLGGIQRALPTEHFGVILADPEWDDAVWSRDTGMDRHASNHYPTSSAEVIASRPVASIAADDCVLFMWTTNQHLRIAIGVLEEWGFDYKSNYCWGKDKIGKGRWNRSKHELLLIGTRGKPPCPAPGTQWESLQLAPKGKHSAKPELFLEMIEEYFPSLPKIELNRRGPAREGWAAWGNEAEEAA